MQVTISEAAKMAKVSRATIYNDIDSGKLSVETGPKEKKMVNAAELQRVYKTITAPSDEKVSKPVKDRQDRQEESVKPITNQVAVLQERLESQKKQLQHLEDMLKKEQEERELERENARKAELFMKEQLSNQSDTIKNFTRLIEDQRSTREGADAWQAAIQKIEKRLANSQAHSQKDIEALKIKAQTQIKRYKQELEAERSRSLISRIFGTNKEAARK